MNIQDHAESPPTPLISAMPRARIPPNAPASVAAEKNRAIRNPHSCLQYLGESVSRRAVALLTFLATYDRMQGPEPSGS